MLGHSRMRTVPAAAMLAAVLLAAGLRPGAAAQPSPAGADYESLRLAIEDLTATFGPRYPRGAEFLRRLSDLQKAAKGKPPLRDERFRQLRSEALRANPLLGFGRLLVVKRGLGSPRARGGGNRNIGLALGLPSNHECNSSLRRTGWDNELAILDLSKPRARLQTLYRPKNGGYVGEVDLHWDATRMLVTQSDKTNWKVWQLQADGTGRRQVSRMPDDVDSFDACYLPDGRIVFGSTASVQSVPCWHGQRRVTNLYLMNADGSGVRQLCFDQDHDFHPVVLDDGQVLFHRWDYVGISHVFQRELMVMNPDGTGQRAIYGSNSWFPNSLYFPRPVPGRPDLLVSVLSGYHGVHRMGRLVLLDTSVGWYGTGGIVHEFPRRGQPIRTAIRDNLVDKDWPKFLHPFPLTDPAAPAAAGKYFLVACQVAPKGHWGIYLVDVFDNLLLLAERPGYALLEPIPLTPTPRPPAVADRVDLARKDGLVYLHNVQSGPGLAGVPPGTVKKLRVLAYHFGYPGLAGPDKVGYGGPWEVMRILGTVPLEADGSAFFRAPAGVPMAVQALDAEGRAVQLMRSWFTVMPGEVLSCVGCHERPADSGPTVPAYSARRGPREITPWRGPARGFDFNREVQPVLNRYCLACHDGSKPGVADLRPPEQVPDYKGLKISKLGAGRLNPAMKKATGGMLRYAPAYDVLIGYIRRVGIEDDVSLLTPGEYCADTSPLVQMLRKGHHGVRLDAEAWDRLVTWIDLNAPCHGTWGEVYPVPDGMSERRAALRKLYGGPACDPEQPPAAGGANWPPVAPQAEAKAVVPAVPGWPMTPAQARAARQGPGSTEASLDLGGGVTMKLVRLPAGEFAMGDAAGEPDERPLARVAVAGPLWMGACEVTNAQFRAFDPSHDPRYYQKRHARSDDQGLWLNEPDQPAVRVSWEQAMAFCDWLGRRTGRTCTLPTEAQWEWACRAGSAAPLSFGKADADFAPWANLADLSFRGGPFPLGKQATGGVRHLVLEGATLSSTRFDDGAIVTAPVGRRRPNAWGLYDMHGNAAEWTRTTYRPYPYREDDGRNALAARGRKVVRGGSFFDPPRRARSAFRLAYPAWRRVFNVGFRVVVTSGDAGER